MDYQKKLKTKSTTAIAEYKKLERENTELAAKISSFNSLAVAHENRKLNKRLFDERLKNEALETVGRDLKTATLRVKELEKKLNVLEFSEIELNDHCHELEGECRGLRCAIEIITREKGE